jgi:uncharacterized membrane protein
VSILEGILGFCFISLPAISAVVGVVLCLRQRQRVSPLRRRATVISLAAVVAENIYFIVMFAILPNGAGPVYNDTLYEHQED